MKKTLTKLNLAFFENTMLITLYAASAGVILMSVDSTIHTFLI